jgi:hypothetical protein
MNELHLIEARAFWCQIYDTVLFNLLTDKSSTTDITIAQSKAREAADTAVESFHERWPSEE